MTPITLRADCKVNLSLRITGVLPNGYHTLDSLFLPLPDPHDLLYITPGATPGLALTSSEPALDPRDNTLTRAYKLYAEANSFSPPLAIRLEKGIPSGAGLGGGSSDAAVLLRYLNDRAPRALDAAVLHAVAARVGADVPFFLQDHPCRVRGIGDVLEPHMLGLAGIRLVLVCPDVRVSTSWAYAAWDALVVPQSAVILRQASFFAPVEYHKSILPSQKTKPSSSDGKLGHYQNCSSRGITDALQDLTKRGAEAKEANFRFHCLNDLEEAVFPAYPELARIKRELFRQGAAAAVMSGSGASQLGLFRDHHAASNAVAFFQAQGLRTYCHLLSC